MSSFFRYELRDFVEKWNATQTIVVYEQDMKKKIKLEWDEKGDNIFIWDFYKYETEGKLYLLDKNAYSPDNAHPNREFAAKVAPRFCKFIIDTIESVSE